MICLITFILDLIATLLAFFKSVVTYHRLFVMASGVPNIVLGILPRTLLFGGHIVFSAFLYMFSWKIGVAVFVSGMLVAAFGKVGIKPGSWLSNIFYKLSLINPRQWQYATFVTISVGVYLLLKRRKSRKLESLADDITDNGMTPANVAKVAAYGLKAGSIVAALMDVGGSIAPKHLFSASIIVELIRAFSDIFLSSKADNDESPEVGPQNRYAGLGWFYPDNDSVEEDEEEDDEFTFLMKCAAFKQRAWALIKSRRHEIGVAALASLCGVAIYLISRKIHKNYERKGKNKGRAQFGGDRKVSATADNMRGRTTKQYILYDDATIQDVLKDGDYVSWKDMINKALPDGDYIITRYDQRTRRFVEDKFTVDTNFKGKKTYRDKDTSEPVSAGKVAMAAHKGKRHRREAVMTCTVCPKYTAKNTATFLKHLKKKHADRFEELSKKHLAQDFLVVCDCGFQGSIEDHADQIVLTDGIGVVQEPKKEALVASSPQFKTDVISDYTGSVYDKDGNYLQQCLCTSLGIVINKHSANDAKIIKVRGITYELGPRRNLKWHADFVVFEKIDGLPQLAKRYFDLPEVGQKVTVLHKDGHSVGDIVKVWKQGGATQCSVSASTSPGWCGSPYVNTNGKVVGIHFSEGEKDRNNWGMAIDQAFLSLWDTSSSSKN